MPKPKLSLAEFSTILDLTDKDGLPLFIIGGHSVNAWGHYFVSKYPQLAEYQPFTSKDLDCIGTLEDILILQKKTGWEWLPGKADPKEFIAGAIRHQASPESPVLLVEVLKRAQGANADEIIERGITIEIEPQERHRVRVPDPLLLLQMKVSNAVSFKQDNPESPRQDVKHVRMLAICTYAFLEELVETTRKMREAGATISEFEVIEDSISKLAETSKTYEFKVFQQTHGLNIRDCIPPIVIHLAETNVPQAIQLAKLLSSLGIPVTNPQLSRLIKKTPGNN